MKYIKDVVFNEVHMTNGNVAYEVLTRNVLDFKPESKWKWTHWTWYKHHITKGKYSHLFTEEEKRNLRRHGM